MKKEYIKPEIVVEEFISEVLMNLGSGGIDINPDDEGEAASNKRQDRRGRWGNLWSQD